MTNRFLIVCGGLLAAAVSAAPASLTVQIAVVGSGSAGPGGMVFARRSDIIRVRIPALPWKIGRVQLAHRTADRDWVISAGAALVSGAASELYFPLPAGGCAYRPMEVVAVVTAAGIPRGRVFTPADLNTLRYVTTPLVFTCGAEQGTVRIVSVSGRTVSPDRELHVSRIERLRAVYDGAASGAFCQVIVLPDESDGSVWAMDDWRIARARSGIEQFTVHFGRAPLRQALRPSLEGIIDRDIYRTFTVYAILTRRILPVRGEAGMSAAEFSEYAGSIIAISRPVRVIRSLAMTGLSVRIESLGSADFSDAFLVRPVERVEGSIATGELYRAPEQGENVILLVRKAYAQDYWLVAGATKVRPDDHSRWVITVSQMAISDQPQSGQRHGREEWRAMAVILLRSLTLKCRVTDEMLQGALAISDEVRYYIRPGAPQ
jgi:hypothetical protein